MTIGDSLATIAAVTGTRMERVGTIAELYENLPEVFNQDKSEDTARLDWLDEWCVEFTIGAVREQVIDTRLRDVRPAIDAAMKKEEP